MAIEQGDQEVLTDARESLERSNLAIRLTNALGYPIERGLEMLPTRWSQGVQRATRAALLRALQLAATTLGDRTDRPPSDRLHRWIVAATGAVSGIAGLPALLVELPISTTLMLRSIADIAQSEEEDIRSLEGRMACLEVFALGGRSAADAAAEMGYFAVRAALARGTSEATRFILERGLVEEGAPVIVRFINAIASRFQVVVSEKILAQAVPLVGAAGGAAVNALFMDHFQEIAHGHFAIRRMERKYGAAEVRAFFEDVGQEDQGRQLGWRLPMRESHPPR